MVLGKKMVANDEMMNALERGVGLAAYWVLIGGTSIVFQMMYRCCSHSNHCSSSIVQGVGWETINEFRWL